MKKSAWIQPHGKNRWKRINWYEENCLPDYKYWLELGLVLVPHTLDSDVLKLCKKYIKK